MRQKVYVVLEDYGHELNCPGKQTPPLRDGTIMKEREFNAAAGRYAKAALEARGWLTFETAPDDYAPWDNSLTYNQNVTKLLTERTARANAFIDALWAKYGKENVVIVMVSVHANAAGDGTKWATGHGIETYYHPADLPSKPLAEAVQRELISATGLRDRGVKTANFLIFNIRSAVPVVLAECGFMDNETEAHLLIDDDYRRKCGEAIAKGICSFAGVEWELPQPQPEPEPTPEPTPVPTQPKPGDDGGCPVCDGGDVNHPALPADTETRAYQISLGRLRGQGYNRLMVSDLQGAKAQVVDGRILLDF